MPGWIFDNNHWRELSNPYVRYNDKVRENHVFTKFNDQIRMIYGEINKDDIVEFKMIYYKPDDKNSGNIPYRIMTTDYKDGIIFEYNIDNEMNEGIVCYEGRLFGVTKNGRLLDLFNNKNPFCVDGIIITNNINFDIQLSYETKYQGYGLYTTGWNSMFSNKQLLPSTQTSSKTFVTDYLLKEEIQLLPNIHNLNNICEIGLIKNNTKEDHMIGANGYLSHNIYELRVDGEEYKFTFEICD